MHAHTSAHCKYKLHTHAGYVDDVNGFAFMGGCSGGLDMFGDCAECGPTGDVSDSDGHGTHGAVRKRTLACKFCWLQPLRIHARSHVVSPPEVITTRFALLITQLPALLQQRAMQSWASQVSRPT